VHLVLSARSRGLIGRDDIALMKSGAILVNTSRGPIVDTEAVIEALEAGRLGYAAFDVYDREPLPAGHPLRRARNVLLTPHVGYVTLEDYRSWYPQIAENIAAYLDGKPLRVI
jgi:phosphoglycerate dehydrogenase-like enzyme